MKLTLDSISKAGGFTGGPLRKEVEWNADGEDVKAEVWVRPMSYHTAVRDIAALNGKGDIIAQRIADCICHEDGSPVFKVSDITGYDDNGKPVLVKNDDGELVERGPLDQNLSTALMVLIGEVSGVGKNRSRSSQKKSSGTS